jgi:hypothetical protein
MKKKSKAGMKSEAQFLREKRCVLPIFEFFVKNKINVEIGSILQPTCICLTVSRVYIKIAQY